MMKVKQEWTDFQVTELTDVPVGRTGDYAFYRLVKRGWTTPDAIRIIKQTWKLPDQRISYGGLKDRHAVTSQYLTIWRGPEQDFETERIQLFFLGKLPTAYRSHHILANQFDLLIRSVTPAQYAEMQQHQVALVQAGLPNYFDDQRFGSVGTDRRFIARLMIDGQYEEALKLALTGEYGHDRAAARQEKELLLQKWGDWKTLLKELPRGHARSLSDYLQHHPTRFGAAMERLRPELQGIYLSAYQSHIWNQTLARWIQAEATSPLLHIPTKLGPLPVPTQPLPGLAEHYLPFPSSRLKPKGDEPWLSHLRAVLEQEQLPLEKMKIRLQKPYFSRGERIPLLQPRNLLIEPGQDLREGQAGNCRLSFELPPGSYATMVIKRLLQTQDSKEDFPDSPAVVDWPDQEEQQEETWSDDLSTGE